MLFRKAVLPAVSHPGAHGRALLLSFIVMVWCTERNDEGKCPFMKALGGVRKALLAGPESTTWNLKSITWILKSK